MSYNYLNFEKKNVKDFPSNLKYLIIHKPTKLKPNEEKISLKLYKETISVLESNHVNMFNNQINTDNVEKFGIDILFDGIKENDRIFYINPIQSVKVDNKYLVSEFDVIKEIKTSDELLEQIINDYGYFDIGKDIFYKGTLNDKYKLKSIEIFKKLNEKEIYYKLNDLFGSKNDLYKYSHMDFNVVNFYDNKKAYDYTIELINNKVINLTEKIDSHDILIERLSRLKWFDLILNVLKSEFITKEKMKEIRERKQIIELLSLNIDDNNVKEIVKILNIELLNFKLIVESGDAYESNIIEAKIFTDIGELKSYLIRQYDIPFNMIKKDIEERLYYDDYEFIIKFNN